MDPSKLFVFTDNVDIYAFSKMPIEIKSRLYYEPQALEDAFQLKIPTFSNSEGNTVIPPDSKVIYTGFWSRIEFRGS